MNANQTALVNKLRALRASPIQSAEVLKVTRKVVKELKLESDSYYMASRLKGGRVADEYNRIHLELQGVLDEK